jgi:DNA-binding MarR family transcriptional regulator
LVAGLFLQEWDRCQPRIPRTSSGCNSCCFNVPDAEMTEQEHVAQASGAHARVPASYINPQLSHRQFRVLVTLLSFNDPRRPGSCFPSIATIAEMTGVDVRHVQRDIRALEAARYLRVDPGGPRRKNRYFFLEPTLAEAATLAATATPAESAALALAEAASPEVAVTATRSDHKSNHLSNQQQRAAADLKERQHEIEAGLVSEGFPREFAASWAADLADLEPARVIAAAHLMRDRDSYRSQRLRNPARYLRVLVNADAAAVTRTVAHDVAAGARPGAFLARLDATSRSLESLTPDERARVETRARTLLSGAGPDHPAWSVAIARVLASADAADQGEVSERARNLRAVEGAA